MPEKLENVGIRDYKPSLSLLIISIAVLLSSCAGNYGVTRQKIMTGYWKSDKGIYISIGEAPGYGISAVIKLAPGYAATEQFKSGKPLIVNITPLADGSFSGIFVVEGGKNVKVRLVFLNNNTIGIVSWDKRVKGRTMKWVRVRSLGEFNSLEKK